ncbi:MAG: hypothetical protein GYB67_10000 [Chloroflexi bacterium]|nr:hypothetical protein [Chloroflexota bacterium]
MSDHQLPIACDLSALPDRAQHEAVATRLLRQTQSVAELTDGYRVAFPVTALALAAEFVDGERRCCPFLDFKILIAPAATALQLHFTGGEGVKAFLQNALLPLLPVKPV